MNEPIQQIQQYFMFEVIFTSPRSLSEADASMIESTTIRRFAVARESRNCVTSRDVMLLVNRLK